MYFRNQIQTCFFLHMKWQLWKYLRRINVVQYRKIKKRSTIKRVDIDLSIPEIVTVNNSD